MTKYQTYGLPISNITPKECLYTNLNSAHCDPQTWKFQERGISNAEFIQLVTVFYSLVIELSQY